MESWPIAFSKEIYNREKKTYIRTMTRADKLVTRDVTKSVAVSNYEKNWEEKSHLPASFWH